MVCPVEPVCCMGQRDPGAAGGLADADGSRSQTDDDDERARRGQCLAREPVGCQIGDCFRACPVFQRTVCRPSCAPRPFPARRRSSGSLAVSSSPLPQVLGLHRKAKSALRCLPTGRAFGDGAQRARVGDNGRTGHSSGKQLVLGPDRRKEALSAWGYLSRAARLVGAERL